MSKALRRQETALRLRTQGYVDSQKAGPGSTASIRGMAHKPGSYKNGPRRAGTRFSRPDAKQASRNAVNGRRFA